MYPYPYKRPRYGPRGVNLGGWGPFQSFSSLNFNYLGPQSSPYYSPTFTSFDDQPACRIETETKPSVQPPRRNETQTKQSVQPPRRNETETKQSVQPPRRNETETKQSVQPPRRNETQTKQSLPEVSSSSNISQPGEPTCNSDLSVITTQQTTSLSPELNTIMDEGLTVTIPKRFYSFLSQKDGTNFINFITQHLNVVVNFINPKSRHFVTCKLEGQNDNLEKAKTAILTFCENGQLTEVDLRQVVSFETIYTDKNSVKKNLDILNNPNVTWFDKAVHLHGEILYLVAKIKHISSDIEYKKSEDKLMLAYQKLNTIFIAKLRNGDDKLHMEILERSTDTAEVEKSFSYVFNSNRRIFSDYEELLDQLAIKFHPSAPQNKACELEELKRKVVSMCNTFKWNDERKRMINRYATIIINNYRDEDVKIFRNQFHKINSRFLGYRKCVSARDKRRNARAMGIMVYNLKR